MRSRPRNETIRKDRASVSLGKTGTAIMRGEADLSEWDDEELLRGQRKSRNGKFHGSAPKVVPKVVHDEWVRRKFAKSYELMQSNLVQAVQELCRLALGAEDEAVRLKAIDLLMKHALPAKPAHLTISLEPKPYELVQKVTIDRDLSDYDDSDDEIRRRVDMRQRAIEAGVIDDDE